MVTEQHPPNSPTVSVIMPCYNGGKTLARAIESVLNQKDYNFDIVIVDDGSTDGSGSVAKRFHFPRIKVLRQTRAGPAAARNLAFRHATGEFIQFLDADDTIEPGKFAAQVQFARESGAAVVYSDWRMIIVGEGREDAEPWVRAEAPTETIEALFSGWWFPNHAALMRRSVYAELGGCDASLMNTSEDFDFWMRVAIKGFPFAYMPGKYANYYRYTNMLSASRANRRDFFEGEAKMIRKAVRLLPDSQLDTPILLRAAARRLYWVARNAYKIDPAWHRALLREVRDLDADFSPTGSWLHRTACQIFGCAGAERVTSLKRWFDNGKWQKAGL